MVVDGTVRGLQARRGQDSPGYDETSRRRPCRGPVWSSTTVGMYAVRAPTCFDGSRFLPGGATVLVADGRVAGVEPFGCDLPEGCELASYDGTLLPGLVDSHVHLVTDSARSRIRPTSMRGPKAASRS